MTTTQLQCCTLINQQHPIDKRNSGHEQFQSTLVSAAVILVTAQLPAESQHRAGDPSSSHIPWATSESCANEKLRALQNDGCASDACALTPKRPCSNAACQRYIYIFAPEESVHVGRVVPVHEKSPGVRDRDKNLKSDSVPNCPPNKFTFSQFYSGWSSCRS